MAYVRRRGNQLVLAQGEREPGTGKVQQRILFTLYSRPEALEALGQPGEDGAARFRSLLSHRYPEVRFDWEAIARGIESNLHVLPEAYEYRGERLRKRFRQDLCGFTRALVLADPQDLASAAELIREHRFELEYLAHLIDWRLKMRDAGASEWTADNPYFWRHTLGWRDVPSDTEEYAADLYEKGDYDRAEAVFRLLVDCFDGYAEGWNYLGLIALERGALEDAAGCFERTIELGRRLFPRRIARSSYWSDHETRPYMRGLRNLTLTLNRAGRYDEALALAGRLDSECGDDWEAAAHRAAIFLNTGRWNAAAEEVQRLTEVWPSEGFIAAFALFEAGRRPEALERFLHGALNYPRAARILLGRRSITPRGVNEVEDHNTGVSLLNTVHAYIGRKASASRKYFGQVLDDPRVAALLEEVETAVREDGDGPRDPVRFQRLARMKSSGFAQAEAWKLVDLAGVARPAPEETH